LNKHVPTVVINTCTYFGLLFPTVLLVVPCVAAMSSLAQLRVRDGYGEAEATKTRQHKADREQKWAATCDAYRVTNQQRMAVRRATECIGTSKAQLVFRYEISGLLHL